MIHRLTSHALVMALVFAVGSCRHPNEHRYTSERGGDSAGVPDVG